MSNVHSVVGSCHLLCVVLENSFGVVGWDDSELRCFVCSGISSRSCDHVKEVSKVVNDDDDGETCDFIELFIELRHNRASNGGKDSWFLRSKSYMPIPFILPQRLKQIMFETSECQIEMNDEGARLIPTIPVTGRKYALCESCNSPWRPESPTLFDWLSETCNIALKRFSLKCFGR